MSTRSIVAVASSDGWVGQYHHSDGYPSGMGSCLFHALKDKTDEELADFFDTLNYHTAGWSNFQVWITPDDPRWGGEWKGIDVDLVGGRCYCHWEGREEPNDGSNTRRADQPAGFREEYLYVVSLHTRKLFIYDTHYGMDILIGVADLEPDADEPDWGSLEVSQDHPQRAMYHAEMSLKYPNIYA
jgi:hypothetical protein